MILALVAGLALAAECEPLDEAGLRARVAHARDALVDDDIVQYTQVQKKIEADLPCLTGPVPPDAWAEYLVAKAIVEHALGEPWQEPLATALDTDPGVVRFGPEDIRNWSPPIETVRTGPALPAGARFYVDGRQVSHTRELKGVHLVQREQGGQWETRLVRNAAWPWPVSTTSSPPVVSGAPSVVRGTAGAIAGFGADRQSPESPGTFLDTRAASGATLGIATRGEVAPGDVGGFWEVAVPYTLGASPSADAYAGVAVGGWIRAGVGLGTVAVTAGNADRVVVVPQPHVGLGRTVRVGDLALDLGLAGGWTPAAAHLLGVAELHPDGTGWAFGADLSYLGARFAQAGSDRRLGASRLRIGLRAGVAFGRGR